MNLHNGCSCTGNFTEPCPEATEAQLLGECKSLLDEALHLLVKHGRSDSVECEAAIEYLLVKLNRKAVQA